MPQWGLLTSAIRLVATAKVLFQPFEIRASFTRKTQHSFYFAEKLMAVLLTD